MIKIRAIHGGAFLPSQDRLEQVQNIFRLTFPEQADYADGLLSLLRDPVGHGYRSVLLLAEGASARVDAFALMMHFPLAHCVFLDYIGVRPGLRGSGIGGALYEAAREYCTEIGAKGLYLDVQPDDPDLTPDPATLDESRKRIRFYEQYGARVILNTAYHEPVGDPPTVAFLIHDGLGSGEPPSRDEARLAVEMILTRRFGYMASPEYIRRVVDSFQDDPVVLRPVPRKREPLPVLTQRLEKSFAIIYTPKHELHHIKERGYFERPIRAEAIRESLQDLGCFTQQKCMEHGEKPLLAVHEAEFVQYLQTVCGKLKKERPVYPDTFPIRLPERRPKALPVQAGYYCIDSGTPLYRNAYIAARAAADAALTGADALLAGKKLAYAVCRPPGHHAGKRFYGGFCYFNNAAVAAQLLNGHGRTTILDIDFHHGNGTQDIFYDRDDVLTLSIHGHPDYAYPYFTGYENETGTGRGLGFNRNFPLKPKTGEEQYLQAFDRALELIVKHRTEILVVSLGYDILKGDPTGTFTLKPSIFRTLGKRLMECGLPLLVVQEGGYNVRNIRRGSAEFFTGCANVASETKQTKTSKR